MARHTLLVEHSRRGRSARFGHRMERMASAGRPPQRLKHHRIIDTSTVHPPLARASLAVSVVRVTAVWCRWGGEKGPGG